MKILLFTLVICLAGSGQETSAPPSPHDTVQPKHVLPTQISDLRAQAEAGDADAENALGVRYMMGEGVEKDKGEAVGWYRKAAKGGSAAAMFNLGAAYYNGDGVGIDDVTSCAWFLLAQEAGYPQADDAVSRATSESATHAIQAAAKIGGMYFKGEELPKNLERALKWFRKAADQGVDEARVDAAAILIGGADPTPDEYAEGRKRCEVAATHDYGPAAYCLAVIYRRGLGVPQDAAEGAKWLIRAANLGHPKAMLQLGEAYWKGDGVKPNLITAYTWVWMAYTFQAAGAQQDEEALRKQMRPGDVEKAKKNAETLPARGHLLVLRSRSPEPSSQ